MAAKKPHKKSIPSATRRMTRAEIEKVNVGRIKHGLKPLGLKSKQRVRSGLKRVTWKTAHYSERQWIEARSGETRDAMSLTRKSEKFKLVKSDRYASSTHFKGLTRRQLIRALKTRAKGKTVVLQLLGMADRKGSRYQEKHEAVWITAGQHFADELPQTLDDVLEEFGFSKENPPLAYGLIVYERKA